MVDIFDGVEIEVVGPIPVGLVGTFLETSTEVLVMPVQGTKGDSGTGAEEVLDALNDHISDTTNVHGFVDTADIINAIDDGPDFALMWANLMA